MSETVWDSLIETPAFFTAMSDESHACWRKVSSVFKAYILTSRGICSSECCFPFPENPPQPPPLFLLLFLLPTLPTAPPSTFLQSLPGSLFPGKPEPSWAVLAQLLGPVVWWETHKDFSLYPLTRLPLSLHTLTFSLSFPPSILPIICPLFIYYIPTLPASGPSGWVTRRPKWNTIT